MKHVKLFEDFKEDTIFEGNELATKRGENFDKMRDVQAKIREIKSKISDMKQAEVDPHKLMILQLEIEKESLKHQSLQVNDRILTLKQQMER
jgi:hypothetical protein